MRTLHSGFSGNPIRRFLPEKDAGEQTLQMAALPGVLVHVLGPSRDGEVIRDMDPPSGQSYLQLSGSDTDSEPYVADPFATEWSVLASRYPAYLRPPDSDCRSIENVGADLEPAVAVALEKAVNGTSLMLMLQIGKAHLLFPGDAQWGTWNAALSQPAWRELMRKTTFYKIGHHGSHNATPLEFVERTVGKDFWAMVSTRPVAQWPRIPKKELLEGLSKRTTRIARSDQEAKAPKASFFVRRGEFIEARIPI